MADAQQQVTAPVLLTEPQAAYYLKIATITLRSWRRKEQGPRFIKFNRSIRYTEEALAEFVRRKEHQ